MIDLVKIPSPTLTVCFFGLRFMPPCLERHEHDRHPGDHLNGQCDGGLDKKGRGPVFTVSGDAWDTLMSSLFIRAQEGCDPTPKPRPGRSSCT